MKNLPLSTLVINILLLTLICVTALSVGTIAKNEPRGPSKAFKRAFSLDDGVNISWLEHAWDKDVFNNSVIKPSDLQLIKQLGFKSIRLPVAFEYFQTDQKSLRKIFVRIDELLKQCKLYGFNMVICYHFGDLNDNNYSTETQRVMDMWKILAARYRHVGGDRLLFDIFNEPPHMDPDKWKQAANEIVTALRKIDANRTLIVGASNFNSIYELSRMTPLADENIIYTFHFYEPFFFTHQGAEWVGDQVATTGVPFPYDAQRFPPLNARAKNTPGESHYALYPKDGNEQSVNDKLQIVKDWGTRYNVPLLCGEYGVYNKYADLTSRCRYIKAVRQALKKRNIPGILWDYNTNFSVFEGKPSMAHLPDCMKDAINYHGK